MKTDHDIIDNSVIITSINEEKKMSENQKGGLENLVKGLGIDSEVVDKVVDAAKDVVGKVDLDKVGETVGNLGNSVKEVLDKTDIDDKILEKGSELLEGILGKDKK